MESSRFPGRAPAVVSQTWVVPSLRGCVQCLRLGSLPAGGEAALDGRTLFVIVPGFDQDEGNRLTGRNVLPPEIERVLERLAALGGYVPVQAPAGLAIVKTGPGPSDDELVRVFRHHCLVELAQVLLSPVRAIRRPSFDPGIETIYRLCVLAGQVFTDQQWRMLPFADD
jgi:hypothetical protein